MSRRFFQKFWAVLLVALVTAIACQSQPQAPNPAESPPSTAVTNVVLNGTGATFPLFLYQRWFAEYNRLHPNVLINYQPTGSAAGIQQMVSGTTDFAASDVAMSDAEIAQVDRGILMLPMTAGSVAVAYNLPGVETALKLSRQVLADIFLGKLTRWNDPAIATTNPDQTLPDLPITLVYRSDGSGTTAAFTAHLNAISSDWQTQVGTGLNVKWPAGVGIKSNAGVSAQIQQVEGTIGYVEYSYAKKLGMAIAALENQSGQFVTPDTDSTRKALSEVQFPANLRAFVPNPAGDGAYPIVTYSWILAYQNYDDPNKADALREVLQYGLTEGQDFSEDLGYVALPPEVVPKVSTALEQIQP
jgi:phosphate transport system substrate-binding protein